MQVGYIVDATNNNLNNMCTTKCLMNG